jgi:hypothetical protein
MLRIVSDVRGARASKGAGHCASMVQDLGTACTALPPTNAPRTAGALAGSPPELSWHGLQAYRIRLVLAALQLERALPGDLELQPESLAPALQA